MSSVFEELVALLDARHARYRVIEHPAEGRSDLVASLRGTLPGQGAKAMLCKSREETPRFVLAVLPGDRKLDFRKVADAAGLKRATLATADEVLRETGCPIGAVPPFSLSGSIALLADPQLTDTWPEIAFNAGRLDRSMVLDSRDYLRIARPALVALSA